MQGKEELIRAIRSSICIRVGKQLAKLGLSTLGVFILFGDVGIPAVALGAFILFVVDICLDGIKYINTRDEIEQLSIQFVSSVEEMEKVLKDIDKEDKDA